MLLNKRNYPPIDFGGEEETKKKMENRYYGVTFTREKEELRHWKYIKKKKINGKWRYYYKNDLGKTDYLTEEQEELTNYKDRKSEFRNGKVVTYGRRLNTPKEKNKAVGKIMKQKSKEKINFSKDIIDRGRNYIESLFD